MSPLARCARALFKMLFFYALLGRCSEFHDVGHSNEAIAMLKDFYKGDLVNIFKPKKKFLFPVLEFLKKKYLFFIIQADSDKKKTSSSASASSRSKTRKEMH